ncbi:hypothetical protein AYO49_00960 [Verrucomicrobiaceae bacterium SCGC AG-212-N21]|nr:hypothetical protein AYO49_00960 [Verrucomicrobiaceae bacterium SCGC AG-212-N21]
MLIGLCLLAVARFVFADVALPGNIRDPATAVEAWNVLHLATANLEKLIAEPRLAEVSVQVSLCAPALRKVTAQAPTPEQQQKFAEFTQRGFQALSSLVQASNVGNQKEAQAQLGKFHAVLDSLKPFFDDKTAAGVIYFCAMHPDVTSEGAYTPCAKCGMKLFPRRIPHSFVFVPPGETTMKMEFAPDLKVTAGHPTHVRFKLLRRDGVPVMHRDLMTMHTQPIHLLIVDAALQDYHHEHPSPTAFSQVPEGYEMVRGIVCGPAPRGSGEYEFTFTPRSSGAYRVFADLVPVDSGVQEYARAELPSAASAPAGIDHSEVREAVIDGITLKLAVVDQNHLPLRARQTRALQIFVSDQAGQPMKQFEPFMNAFAHLVGFYEDGSTVVHLHPEGGDILRADVRGGPFLNFRFHPPKAGYLRLFCQIQVEGKTIMAPFGVSIID